MFLRHLGEYEAGSFSKVIIEAAPMNRDFEDLDDVVRLARHFDFESYWTAESPKQLLGEFVVDGFQVLARALDWDLEPIRNAFDEMKARQWNYVVDWRRPITAPSRLHTAQVRYYYGPTEVRVVAVIRSRKTASDLVETELARTLPHELKFVPLLGRLHWVDSATLQLSPRKPGLRPIVVKLPGEKLRTEKPDQGSS